MTELDENVVKASGSPIIAEKGRKVTVEINKEDGDESSAFDIKFKSGKGGAPREVVQIVKGMRLGEIRKFKMEKKTAFKKYGFDLEANVETWFTAHLKEVDRKLPDIEVKVDLEVAEDEIKGTILFMHGWPDDETVFESQRAFCAKNGYRCLYYTLPWFGPKKKAMEVAKEKKYKKYGYEHDVLVDAIAIKLYDIIGEDSKTYLVCHDWGAYHSQLLRVRHPHLVERTVQVDVESFRSTHFPNRKGLPGFLILGVIYMYMLVWSHHLSQLYFPPFSSVANWMHRNRAKSLKKLKNKDIKVDVGFSRQNYVYTKFRKDVFRRLIGVKGSQTSFCYPGSSKAVDHSKDLIRNTLFVYGKEKKFMFHGKGFEKKLMAEDNACSAAKGLDADHWVSLDCPDILSEMIINYFENPEETCTEIKVEKKKEDEEDEKE